METNVEEQLRTTLYYDDKEKLRRKLELLQREYVRTAQRLQRAERLEAVRRHVRSRISQHNHQDQRDPEGTSDASSSVNTANAKAQGPAATDNLRKSQVIRFLLPSDAACPQTPDPSYDGTRGHRPSPALRLRSRRSRLRWEKKSAEADRILNNNEKGQEQIETTEVVKKEGEEEKNKSERTEVVNENEELLSASESESPSLLLTHWNPHSQTETGDMEGRDIPRDDEQMEKESERAKGKKASPSLLLNCSNPAIPTEERQVCTPEGKRKAIEGGNHNENRGGDRNITFCEETTNKDINKNAADEMENNKRHDNFMEIKEDKSVVEGDGKGPLDSCTLVEGLIFPAEYYVRTTRRMTLSQSQPDMEAVILSQLRSRPHRRSRGRGRGLTRNINTSRYSDEHTQTDFSSPTTSESHNSLHVPTVDAASEFTGNSQSLSKIESNKISPCLTNIETYSSTPLSTKCTRRGRRRKRGRGRGRTQTPQSPVSLDIPLPVFEQTSDDHQPTSSPMSSSLSLHGANGPNLSLTPGEPVPLPYVPQPVSTHITASQVNGAQCSSASGHVEKVYSIFLKSSGRTDTSAQMSRTSSSWQSLLLPPCPPAQTSLLPVPSPIPLVRSLMNTDMHQDFHLPDDQFASLKLHKLRQVAMESRIERFDPPSHITRRSSRRCLPQSSTADPLMPLPLPIRLTPTIENSKEKQAVNKTVDVENILIDHKPEDQSFTEKPPKAQNAQTSGEQQTEDLDAKTQTSSSQAVSQVQGCTADCLHQDQEPDTLTLNTDDQKSIPAGNTHPSSNYCVNSQPHTSFADRPAGKENDLKPSASEKHTDCVGAVGPVADERSKNHQTEDKAVKTLSFDCPLEETSEETLTSCAAVQMCKDSDAPGEFPVKPQNVDSSELHTVPFCDTSVENKNQNERSTHHRVHSQLLVSPLLASAPSPSTLLTSPTLPCLGMTPDPVSPCLPLTSSPSAPALTLPPPHSPSTQALSPPALSPCPSITYLPPGQPLASPSGHNQAPPELSEDPAEQHHKVEPASCPTTTSIQSLGEGGQLGLTTGEAAEQHMMRNTHTLKAPAGGCLVDTCCLPGPSGSLYIAAAGKWAVCLWSQTTGSDWSLIHTWTFKDPVINVFPIPDTAGLMFVTLGQLEIREVRMLSCSSLIQLLLCEGIVQTVVGVSNSRVVASCHSAAGSTLKVFTLSDNNSTPSSQPLVSPGVCVGAIAPVDGLPDALIGTDEGGHVFIWNLKSGQLLRRIILGDVFSHTAALRGYAYNGVLFVLLQHQLLSSLEGEEKEAKAKDEMLSEQEEEEERKRTAFFSLVAINPLSSKSVLATQLYPPKAWSGRLCEADVSSSSVVGLSQSGCVCVWELEHQGAVRMVWAPESEGWQLARWGGQDTLVTGHHNGDVTLHCCRLN
ncbi:partner and localizer of BRCA2 isoform X1 [Echeneis naucrates]|nr:partner and localizer of BRCA2 isoform X1 [Echeneis naucrates]